MVRATIPPLLGRFTIVDPKTGNPTLPFCKVWQDFFTNEAGTHTVATDAATVAGAAVPGTRVINTTAPLAGGGPLSADLTLSHNTSGVTAGSYTSANITVDADGHVTAAVNGGSGAGTPWWFSPPATGGFTLVSGDSTLPTFATDADLGPVLKFNSASVLGDIMRCAFEPITTPTAAWTYDVRMSGTTTATTFNGCGPVVRNEANARNIGMFIGHDGSVLIQRRTMTTFSTTAFTVFSASLFGWAAFASTFFRISFDTANVIFWLSADGKYWHKLYTEPVSTYLTAAPDKIGFGMFTSNNAGVTDDFALSVQRRVKSW